MSERAEHAPRQVVGLRYERGGDGAPSIVAKGRGELAERILAIARASGVPIHEDPDLVALLSSADVGEEIPADVYEAVARLLAWLWSLRTPDGVPAAAGEDREPLAPSE